MITSELSDKFYIGSTFNELTRYKQHKDMLFKNVSRKVYSHFAEVCEGNIIFSTVATYEVENEEEKRQYEQVHIDEHMNDKCLNTRRAYTGINLPKGKEYDKAYNEQYKDEQAVKKKIYNEKHADKIKLNKAEKYAENAVEIRARQKANKTEEQKESARVRARDWHHANKEKAAARSKQYRDDHAEELKEKSKNYNQTHKDEIAANKKIYHKDNAEEIAIKHKKWREEHVEELKEKRKEYHQEKSKERIRCDICDTLISKFGMSNHCKTKKHIHNQSIEKVG